MDESGGTVLNTLTGGGTEKRGGEQRFEKMGEQAGSRGGCLKKGEAGTPLRTMYYHKTYLKHTLLRIHNRACLQISHLILSQFKQIN